MKIGPGREPRHEPPSDGNSPAPWGGEREGNATEEGGLSGDQDDSLSWGKRSPTDVFNSAEKVGNASFGTRKYRPAWQVARTGRRVLPNPYARRRTPLMAMATALLLIDVQRDMLEPPKPVPAHVETQRALESLLSRARISGAFVVHVQNDGSPGDPDAPNTPGWELVFPWSAGSSSSGRRCRTRSPTRALGRRSQLGKSTRSSWQGCRATTVCRPRAAGLCRMVSG